MKSLPKIIVLSFILISLGACDSLWLRFSGVLEESPDLEILENGNKRLVYLPIHHVGREVYYQKIARISDSLQAEAYTMFYEQVGSEIRDAESFYLVGKKFRKLTGSFNAGNGYLDTLNHKIGEVSYNPKYRLMNQPDLPGLGIDTSVAIRADVLLEELIAAFEAKHGLIELDSCDLATDLESEYNCSPVDKELQEDFRDNFILGMRNSALAKRIQESEAQKIYVIYGASHFKGLREELRKLDAHWN